MSAVIEAHVAQKQFGASTILSDVRLTLAPREIVSLVGASGCGKSTLLRMVAGLDRDFRGSVRLDGAGARHGRSGLGFVFQEPRLFPWLSVADNIAFGTGRSGREDPRVTALLQEVGLGGLQDRLPKQLSGGQAQRVAIARALYEEPRALLLDEPFSAVDAFTRMKLQDLVAGLAQTHGIAVLLVTHDVEEAVLLADRVLVLGARPACVLAEIPIPLARPRARKDSALAALRNQVLSSLDVAHDHAHPLPVSP